jgi:Fe-S oxidoreductase
MATYKAEFRSHHYRRRLRPRSAYSMGLIYWWARMGSRAPRLANAIAQGPGTGSLAKFAGGIAQRRNVTRLADETFTSWFRRRPNPGNGRRVLLWPDTFNNFFRPETAAAATHVLEAAGFAVAIPSRPLCCGRPLYDWGWLDRAKALWRQTMAALREDIAAGTPIVGLEPACLAAFKDELPNLFPDDRLAQKLSDHSVYLADFLAENAERLPQVPGQALVQIHCNHHAVIKSAGESRLLDRLGLDHEIMHSGCCGMAGAFGFAADTYDVSMAVAERVLLPKVRGAHRDTLILADGFSCREQIEQATDRPTLHIAEAMARALAAPR